MFSLIFKVNKDQLIFTQSFQPDKRLKNQLLYWQTSDTTEYMFKMFFYIHISDAIL